MSSLSVSVLRLLYGRLVTAGQPSHKNTNVFQCAVTTLPPPERRFSFTESLYTFRILFILSLTLLRPFVAEFLSAKMFSSGLGGQNDRRPRLSLPTPDGYRPQSRCSDDRRPPCILSGLLAEAPRVRHTISIFLTKPLLSSPLSQPEYRM